MNTKDFFSYSLLKRLTHEWARTGFDITSSFLSPGDIDTLLERKPRSLIDVRFESELSKVNALPWEALSLTSEGFMPFSMAPAIRFFYRSLTRESGYPDRKIRCLQSVLNKIMSSKLVVDGIWGTSTQDTLMRFQEKYNIQVDGVLNSRTIKRLREIMKEGSPRVLIIQASSEYEKQMYRSTLGRGINLERFYRGYYECDVSSLRKNSVDELRYFLGKFSPQIIHMVGTIKEQMRTGEVFIDFGESRYRMGTSEDEGSIWQSERSISMSSQSFSTKIISGLLNDLPLAFSPPLLIIEPASSPGETEWVRQLFLRNVLAAEIFQLADAPDIIATGIGPDEEAETFHHNLISSLFAEENLGGVVDRIRGREMGKDEDEFVVPKYNYNYPIPGSNLTTALFTNNPYTAPF